MKTDGLEKHSPRSRKLFVTMQRANLQREAKLTKGCGYDIVIRARSEAHRTALKVADPTLDVVITA
ncbi:DUF6310 domain-containing protein [Corallococcus sp. CA041A]|uniref:DUF6310 domain-containing protein n=1 Tax=Corallococcus sp. CA041A TaxID=2316727 RepID=UPI0034CE3677